jgi:NAD-dependent SIR2 family protein deacetylase
MPSESRTFIALSDISGVEFECPKCQAKILYPIKKHYEPLPPNCPSCGQIWFDENPNRAADQPTVAELVQRTLISLHNITETPAIRAHVRLNVNNLSPKDVCSDDKNRSQAQKDVQKDAQKAQKDAQKEAEPAAQAS